jgi:Protein of unknown function (DUF3224)
MMKRLLTVPLVLCALMLGATTAVAGPPEGASGDWTYVPDLAGLTFRTAGNTTFVDGTEVSTFTGTFVGTSDDEFVVVCHQKGPESFMNFVKITIDFTGEVDGRVGGLTMKATGKQDSTTCDPSGAIWSGKWVILGGTGDLADLHGNGAWTGPSFDLDYTGKVHFN